MYAYGDGTSNPPTSFFFGQEYMQTRMYQNSLPKDLELANTLVRPAPSFPDLKSIEEVAVSKEKYGSVHRVFIKSGVDKGIVPPLQKYMIENNPPDEVKEISDSDHMVMFSKPNELCSYLLGLQAWEERGEVRIVVETDSSQSAILIHGYPDANHPFMYVVDFGVETMDISMDAQFFYELPERVLEME
ncbi:hypothetical protein LguiA_017453 [Lonicera macranthoides]